LSAQTGRELLRSGRKASVCDGFGAKSLFMHGAAAHLFEQLNLSSCPVPARMPGAYRGDMEHQNSTPLCCLRSAVQRGGSCPVKALFKPASARGTDNRRRRTAEPYFPRPRRGKYRPTDRSEPQRIQALPAFFARLRTADHRQFRPSKDQCFGSPLRVPACRWQCRRIAVVRPGVERDKSRKRPPVYRRKDSPHRC
jgi:hypothetical protein